MRLPSHPITWVILGLTLVAAVLVLLPELPTAPPRGADVSPSQSPAENTLRSVRAASNDPLPAGFFDGTRSHRPAVPPAQLIERLFDGSLPEKDRHAAALDLARLGTDEAMLALKSVLADTSASASLKAAIAEALGECFHPDARPLLRQLAHAENETVAGGAIRGLAAIDDSAALSDIVSLLDNDRTPATLRTETALALGAMQQSGALDALKSALAKAADSPFAKDVLEGIGRRPFEETREFFSEYLQAAHVPPELRRTALEALAQSPGDTTQFLLAYAGDSDAKTRAAAAWALSAADEVHGIAPQLTGLLQQETDQAVRLRLYQALARQGQFDVSAVQTAVAMETDLGTRLEGFRTLASAVNTSEAAGYFDQHAVPELTRTAVGGATLQQRLSSVIALQRAKTPAARAALEGISQQSSDARVVKAAQAALSRPH